VFAEGVRKTKLERRAFIYDASIEIDYECIASSQHCYIPLEDDTICILSGKALLNEVRHKLPVSLGQKDVTPSLQSATEAIIFHFLGKRK
jgi:hypothetical protein